MKESENALENERIEFSKETEKLAKDLASHGDLNGDLAKDVEEMKATLAKEREEHSALVGKMRKTL